MGTRLVIALCCLPMLTLPGEESAFKYKKLLLLFRIAIDS